MPTIILASASPRRRELMALTGLDFEVRPAAVRETPRPGESAGDFVQRLSAEKAAEAAETSGPDALVVGADTVVVLDNQIIGKPTDAEHAFALLQQLRGRPHLVLTGLTVLDPASGARLTDLVSARVPMRAYADHEIEAYVASGNPLDKAGAYAIQYAPFQPVDLARFQDCFANVMGLPLCRLLSRLHRLRPHRVPQPAPLADCARYAAADCPFVAQVMRDGAL